MHTAVSRNTVILAFAGMLVMLALTSPALASGKIEVNAVTSRVQLSRRPAGRTGDVESLTWYINDRYGRRIGRAFLICRWQRILVRECYGEVRLPLGKIAVIGTSQTRSFGVFSVVGGTGRYTGAGGEMTFRAIGIRRLSLIIII